MHLRSTSVLAVVASLFFRSPALHAQPATPTPFQQRVLDAMQGEIRTPEERARDVNRLPVEILSFFRMREDMRVIEILPAGGWFTKILGPVLKDKGKLYVTHPEGRYAQRSAHRGAAGPREGRGDRLGCRGGGQRRSFGPSGKWAVEPVDLAVTFRNYHNFSPADRATVNRSTFDALKPGGYYGIVDHTRRHNEPHPRENGRRVDPVLVIKEVQDAGFVLVDFSNLYYRPNDALALEVANPAVNDRTDRIALLFRKPEQRRGFRPRKPARGECKGFAAAKTNDSDTSLRSLVLWFASLPSSPWRPGAAAPAAAGAAHRALPSRPDSRRRFAASSDVPLDYAAARRPRASPSRPPSCRRPRPRLSPAPAVPCSPAARARPATDPSGRGCRRRSRRLAASATSSSLDFRGTGRSGAL